MFFQRQTEVKQRNEVQIQPKVGPSPENTAQMSLCHRQQEGARDRLPLFLSVDLLLCSSHRELGRCPWNSCFRVQGLKSVLGSAKENLGYHWYPVVFQLTNNPVYITFSFSRTKFGIFPVVKTYMPYERKILLSWEAIFTFEIRDIRGKYILVKKIYK